MTSKEIHEQISAYVAERVDESQVRKKIVETIEYAPQSAAAYELELKAKTIVHASADPTGGIGVLSNADAAETVQHEDVGSATPERSPRRREPWIDRWCDFILAPANIGLAVGLLVFGGYFLLRGERSGAEDILADLPDKVDAAARSLPKGPVNLFNLASLNFESILAKQFELQESTADKEELKKFFADNSIAFAVTFPVKGKLVGGSVSGSGSDAVAHQIYSLGESVAYSIQTPRQALTGGKQAYLTPDMLKRLDAGERIVEQPGATESILLFKQNDVVCAVIANVPREQISGIITSQ